jgi:hypothetical protein
MSRELQPTAPLKRKRSRAKKMSGGQRLLLATAFVPLGVELIRLIEELLKMFQP